jgi:hypothetical protein
MVMPRMFRLRRMSPQIIMEEDQVVLARRPSRPRKIAAAVVAASSARRLVKHDLKAATSSYRESLTSGLGLFAGAGLLGLLAVVVLTVGFVVGLNLLLGSPAGYFITAGVYLLAAGLFVGVAVHSRREHKKEAQEHVQEARDDARLVVLPLRAAFGKNGK